MSSLIVSVSGVRGIVGETLFPETASLFAAALAQHLPPGSVVVGRDSRPSGEMLLQSVLAGLISTGRSIDNVGIVPTPTMGVAVKHLGAAGGIQITASHNPAPWNGLKLFGDDGAVLPANEGRKVKFTYESGQVDRAAWDGLGSIRVPPDPLDRHLRLVLDAVHPAEIAGRGFHVFLDGNGGAGGPLGVRLLNELGCKVLQHHCEADGQFVHEPEPTPASLAEVAAWVANTRSHIGLALDPDSDRLALIDETGRCLSEEWTLALAVKARLRQEHGPVVINMSTSRVIEDLARAAGCPCERSAVGEANVVELMRARGAVIGGEGNGGVIDPRIGWVRDPFIGMAMILQLMAEERKPLSRLAAELPHYAMVKAKFAVPTTRMPEIFTAFEKRWPQAQANRLDGLRLDDADWWLHVRASNTEPIVRVIAESPTSARTEQLIGEAEQLLQQFNPCVHPDAHAQP